MSAFWNLVFFLRDLVVFRLPSDRGLVPRLKNKKGTPCSELMQVSFDFLREYDFLLNKLNLRAHP